MVAAGIEYAKGYERSDVCWRRIPTPTFRIEARLVNALGLANTIVFHSFSLTYVRQINPNLSVTGQIGLVGVTNAFTLGLPKTLLPTLFAGVAWAITPKMTLTASASQDSRAPDDAYRQRAAGVSYQLNLTYQATPKVAFSASAARPAIRARRSRRRQWGR